MRVLFVAIAVLTIGFLGFVPMLRLALTTRSKVDWRVFIGVAAVQLVCWIAVFSDPGGEEFTTWYGNAGMGLMLINLAVSVTYYLIADIRHAHRNRQPLGAPLYGVPGPQQQYGYPQPQPQPRPQPYAQPQPPAPPSLHAMPTQVSGPAPTPVPPTPPTPAPRSQTPPPHRIDQVRAELDELSDYLRREDGGR
ncbi:hypothetical protein [Streptomyces sp. NPDC046939]|uniref:hypothetical protein n=1 Tax=Streptomyces sp. NPDC046939 TaxID=3155376 RepID=UPI0033D72C55